MTHIVITLLVVVHFAAAVWHGDAHTRLAIDLPPAKDAFVYTVIMLAPVVAAGLVWTRHLAAGTWLFFLSMLGALLFGVYHHYVLVSPDHVGHLPSGSPASHAQFASSAAAIALLELVSALYGAFSLGARRPPSRGIPA